MTEEEEKELRSGCWCADTRKPCTYHEGWLDGYEHGQRAASAAVEAAVNPTGEWEWDD